jgi:hypothetical protein
MNIPRVYLLPAAAAGSKGRLSTEQNKAHQTHLGLILSLVIPVKKGQKRKAVSIRKRKGKKGNSSKRRRN